MIAALRPATFGRPAAAMAAAGLAIVAAAGLVALLWSAANVSAAQAPVTAMEAYQRRAVLESGRVEIQAVLATPAYFRATGQLALAEKYASDLVVILSQDVHYGDLPARPRPLLSLDGRSHAPSRVETVAEGPHHRTSLIVYAGHAGPARPALAQLQLAGAAGELSWERPFEQGRATPQGLSIPLLLALVGGLLASMWPCLFQLTAYFLPSVAGLSMERARSGSADAAVLRTAVLFVSGIVVVYTLAGLAAGFAAQSVAGTTLFEASRQPITLVAGVVIVGMAVRLALRARRPLACHMPAAPATRRGGVGTVLLGLAFATGCMTCFGAAVVLGMFTYILTTASPLVGAAIMFVFSLGVAVPLVAAAVAMARVLPMIARLERVAPAMMIVSALIMAGYGALLITGSSHIVSDAVARIVGLG